MDSSLWQLYQSLRRALEYYSSWILQRMFFRFWLILLTSCQNNFLRIAVRIFDSCRNVNGAQFTPLLQGAVFYASTGEGGSPPTRVGIKPPSLCLIKLRSFTAKGGERRGGYREKGKQRANWNQNESHFESKGKSLLDDCALLSAARPCRCTQPRPASMVTALWVTAFGIYSGLLSQDK